MATTFMKPLVEKEKEVSPENVKKATENVKKVTEEVVKMILGGIGASLFSNELNAKSLTK